MSRAARVRTAARGPSCEVLPRWWYKGGGVRRLTHHENWGRRAGLDAGRAAGRLLLATRRRPAHLPHKHRRAGRRPARADLRPGGSRALPGTRARRPARVHDTPRRPLDDRQHPAQRIGPAVGERHRPRLLGTGLRRGLGAPARARAGTDRSGLPVRERHARGVSDPRAARGCHAGPSRVPDWHTRLSAGCRFPRSRPRATASRSPPCGTGTSSSTPSGSTRTAGRAPRNASPGASATTCTRGSRPTTNGCCSRLSAATMTGRLPACSCPRAGFRFAQRMSPLSIRATSHHRGFHPRGAVPGPGPAWRIRSPAECGRADRAFRPGPTRPPGFGWGSATRTPGLPTPTYRKQFIMCSL